MTDDRQRALICSSRSRVIDDLVRELAALAAEPLVARNESEWPADPPTAAFLDLAGGIDIVRDARGAFGPATRLLAVVDNESATRLIRALAAGCDDYIFFPVNSDELALTWCKQLEADRRPLASTGPADRISIEFPSDVAYLEEAVAQIVTACEEREMPGARLNMRVALAEAVANAILYGNRQDPSKRVRVRAEFAPDRVAVTVTDEGSGFDPALVPDPTQPENRWRSHGRGLFLLHNLMDEVRYNDVGNAVTLVLRR